jgi:hypothetical protein
MRWLEESEASGAKAFGLTDSAHAGRSRENHRYVRASVIAERPPQGADDRDAVTRMSEAGAGEFGFPGREIAGVDPHRVAQTHLDTWLG